MGWRGFDFKCNNVECGWEGERMKWNDDPVMCSECGQELQKMLALPAKQFETIVMGTPKSREYSAGGVHKRFEKSDKIWVPVGGSK
jgi:hypothetical protein